MSAWDEPDPGEIRPLANDADWEALVDRYATLRPRSFTRCLNVARSHAAASVVVETRYIDADYRSEFSAHYSTSFASFPDATHRLHFFKATVRPEEISRLDSVKHGYLGYIVVRPVPTGPVGHAMLAPPDDMASAVRCAVAETVHLFGSALTVKGVPFAEQDTQLGACAHVTAWICHRTASLRGDLDRRTLGQFATAADPSLSAHREVPTRGLTLGQMSDVIRRHGLSPLFYRPGDLPAPNLPWTPMPAQQNTVAGDGRLIAVLCRHLNSGFPVMVAAAGHAFNIVGWMRDPAKPAWIRFVRHDDQRGPYLWVDDLFNDVDPGSGDPYGKWEALIVPLPPKVWLPPENAEEDAYAVLSAASAAVAPHLVEGVETIADLVAQDRLALRTSARLANRFKSELSGRGFDAVAEEELRVTRMPRRIWVVEAVDRQARAAGAPPVLGEVTYDSTSSELAPLALSVRIHGCLWVHQTASGGFRGPILTSPANVTSAGVGPP